eukprot:TRINITY_DN2671_c1_g2_i1.p1 TRINITY_DN2671_c1_g2~~TRINITY_DN2671_c1_g2_i1.p1  ORF type:complete len:1503 (-),score=358.42 TRINITY_DN2671_c1_g2_i1:177-4601(-)
MVPRKAVLPLLLLSPVLAFGFEPFADVDELRPRRLRDFCGPKDPSSGLAHCRHSVRKTLDDGGDVALDWHMQADPDAVISVDAEAAQGARIVRCTPGALELDLPADQASQLKPGSLVTASRFAHACGHLASKALFGKVLKVQKRRRLDAATSLVRTRVSMKELGGIAEAVPSASINFSYMPLEARDEVPYPEMRTNLGSNRRLMESFGSQVHSGNPESRTSSGGGASLGSMLKFTPKQISNFGWNWNFFLNSTEEPEFNYTLPGMKGYVKLKQPYIKVHAGIFLNFSSRFAGLTLTPHVQWKAGILGHGVINARMMTDMKTTSSVAEDPFHMFEVPALERLRTPHWLGDMALSAGPMPFHVEPGFSFKVEMYHKGHFEGTLQLGGKTHALVYPLVYFDSEQGLAVKCKADFKDTTFYPPLWMIETDHFEMGFMFEPTVWIRGQLGHEKSAATPGAVAPAAPGGFPMQRRLQFSFPGAGSGGFGQAPAYPQAPQGPQAYGYPPAPPATGGAVSHGLDERMGFELRPFLNLTIKRETDSVAGDEMHQLIVYPFRVIGLSNSDPQTKYVVKISCNGAERQSTPLLNFGQVEITDHFRSFNFGNAPKKTVMAEPIDVTLLEVDGSGASTTLATSKVLCGGLLNGECSPEPALTALTLKDGTTAYVELAILWMENPVPWFASRIRGVDLSFSEVKLNSQAIAAAIPELKASAGTKPSQPLFLRLTHGGRSYGMELTDFSSFSLETPVTLKPKVDLSFGVDFIEAWKPCGQAACEKGSLELVYGGKVIAHSKLPSIPWNSVGDLVTATAAPDEDISFMDVFSGKKAPDSSSLLFGMSKLLGEGVVEGVKEDHNIPLSMSLQPVASTTDASYVSLAFVHAIATITDPTRATSFLSPDKFEQVAAGDTKQLLWTVENAQQGPQLSFRISALRLGSTGSAGGGASSAGDRSLTPIAGSVADVSMSCANRPVRGMRSEDTPCSFQHLLSVDASTYAVGSMVVLQVEWETNGVRHVMQSAPMGIVAPGSGTAASAAAEASSYSAPKGFWSKSSDSRRLWTEEDWNSRLAANARSCSKRDLHFDIGWGALMRAKMEDASEEQKKMMPMLGGMMPKMSTEFEPLTKNNLVDKDLADVLPKVLCQDGVCSGQMPGCTKANFKVMHFPELTFNFNRAYKYADLGQGHREIKMAMAYAFSMLPEMVEVALAELNSTHFGGITTTPHPGAYGSFPGAHPAAPAPAAPYQAHSAQTSSSSALTWPGSAGMKSNQGVPAAASTWSSPTYAAAPAGTTGSAAPVWPPAPAQATAQAASTASVWQRQRRLRSTGAGEEKAADAAVMKKLPNEAQVVVRFPQGVHFAVDRSLVDMMLRHGMFQEVEDDLTRKGHGPLSITSYSIGDEGAAATGGAASNAAASASSHLEDDRHVRRPSAVAAAAGSGSSVLAASLAALAVLLAATAGCAALRHTGGARYSRAVGGAPEQEIAVGPSE